MPAKNDQQLLSIGQLSKKLGVSITTLRRWDQQGKLRALRTPGGQRRYREDQITSLSSSNSPSADTISLQKPQLLLYAVLAAIATTQIFYLTLTNVKPLQRALTHVSSSFITATMTFTKPQSQPAFNHAVMSQILYSGTKHYTAFAQGFNKVTETGTYILVTSAQQAAHQMTADISHTVSLAFAVFDPPPFQKSWPSHQLAYSGQVLGATTVDLNTQADQNRGSVIVNTNQTQITVVIRHPENSPWSTPPDRVVISPSYATTYAVTDVTSNGFTVVLKNTPSRPETLHWLALW